MEHDASAYWRCVDYRQRAVIPRIILGPMENLSCSSIHVNDFLRVRNDSFVVVVQDAIVVVVVHVHVQQIVHLRIHGW